jgi:hypothetical protein
MMWKILAKYGAYQTGYKNDPFLALRYRAAEKPPRQ